MSPARLGAAPATRHAGLAGPGTRRRAARFERGRTGDRLARAAAAPPRSRLFRRPRAARGTVRRAPSPRWARQAAQSRRTRPRRLWRRPRVRRARTLRPGREPTSARSRDALPARPPTDSRRATASPARRLLSSSSPTPHSAMAFANAPPLGCASSIAVAAEPRHSPSSPRWPANHASIARCVLAAFGRPASLASVRPSAASAATPNRPASSPMSTYASRTYVSSSTAPDARASAIARCSSSDALASSPSACAPVAAQTTQPGSSKSSMRATTSRTRGSPIAVSPS